MDRFLSSFGFIRIDAKTWRWQDAPIDLCAIKIMDGAEEFVRLTDGLGNITYWQTRVLGLNWDEFTQHIRRAERKQRG